MDGILANNYVNDVVVALLVLRKMGFYTFSKFNKREECMIG